MKQAPDTKRLLEALNQLKKEKGVSIYQIAQKIGYAPQSFSRIKSGGQNMPIRWIHKICDTYNINKNYVFLNEEPMLMDGSVKKPKKADISEVQNKLPLYEAGITDDMKKVLGDNILNPNFFTAIPHFADCTFALRVSGESMSPRYRSGDIVVCKQLKDRNLILHGEPYVVLTSELCTLKYLDPHPTDPHKFILRSENPKFSSSPINKKNILLLFVIKGKVEVS